MPAGAGVGVSRSADAGRPADPDAPFGVGLLDVNVEPAGGDGARDGRPRGAASPEEVSSSKNLAAADVAGPSAAPAPARASSRVSGSVEPLRAASSGPGDVERDVAAARASEPLSQDAPAADDANVEGRVRRRRSSVSSRIGRGRGAAKKSDPEDVDSGEGGWDGAGDATEPVGPEEGAGDAAEPVRAEGVRPDDGAGDAAEPVRAEEVRPEEGAGDAAETFELPEGDATEPRAPATAGGRTRPGHDAEFVEQSPGHDEESREASIREEARPRRARGRRRRSRGRSRHGERAGLAVADEARPGSESPEEGARRDERGSASREPWGDRPAAGDGRARRDEGSAPPREAPAADDAVELPAWVEPVEEGPDFFRRSRRQRRDLMTAGGAPGTAAGEDEDEESVQGRDKPARRAKFKRILINADDSEEVRIAVVEDGRLEELYYDRPGEKRYLGNIYKGRVVNLEPAIQAAFVDIGIGRNGFLHVSDVLPAYKDSESIPIDSLSQRLADRRRLRIQEILRDGQEVLVQISKDAIGAKGPSLTTYVSVPGKFLVLMPGVSRHGVSKRIRDDEDRHDLRKELANLNPPKGMGYIVRTAGHGCTREEFDKDFRYLMKVWDELCARVRKKHTPTLCYAESDLVIRTMRDLFGPDVDEILVDDNAVFERARDFCAEVMAEANTRLKLYAGVTPIFTRFGVEEEIEKIYNRKVPLPSGGHIVVEQTEALVAIDVNSGKYRDEEDLEATALKTNLEAAEVIARELRLRDFGGIIINDFIDMERESNRREVERAFRRALKGERAKCWVSRISRFGIIEMTRQRVRPSFERDHYEPCRCCRGTGVVKTARSTGMAILRQARAGMAVKRKKTCEIAAHPEVVDYLLNDRRSFLAELEQKYQKRMTVVTSPDFAVDQFVVRYF